VRTIGLDGWETFSLREFIGSSVVLESAGRIVFSHALVADGQDALGCSFSRRLRVAVGASWGAIGVVASWTVDRR